MLISQEWIQARNYYAKKIYVEDGKLQLTQTCQIMTGGSGLLQLPDLSVISTPFRQDSHSTRQFGLFGERVIALHHQKKKQKGESAYRGYYSKELVYIFFHTN